MAEEMKIFLRFGVLVSQLEGKIGVGTTVTRARVRPILGEGVSVTFPISSMAETFLIDLDKSVDQHIWPDNNEVPISWDEIEIEGVGVTANGQRASPLKNGQQIVLNSLGERWPDQAKLIGVLSAAEKFFKDNQIESKSGGIWPYEHLQPYQCVSVLYNPAVPGPKKGKRYVGFQAEITQWSNNKDLVKVKIWKTIPPVLQGEWWFETNNTDQCDWEIAFSNSEVAGKKIEVLNSGSELHTKSGLFIEMKHAAKLGLLIDPKTPYSAG